jgi:hypothetical protein
VIESELGIMEIHSHEQDLSKNYPANNSGWLAFSDEPVNNFRKAHQLFIERKGP